MSNPIQPIPKFFINNPDNGRWLEDVRLEINRVRAYSGVTTDASSSGEIIIGVTDSSSPRTITLSTADLINGKIIIIKDEDGNAGGNNITIDTQGSETIDGAASITINTNYGYKKIYSNGSNWFVIT